MAQGVPPAVVATFEQVVENQGGIERDGIEAVRRVHLAPAFPGQAQQGHQPALCPAAADVGLEDIEYPTAEGIGAIGLREEPNCVAATGREDALGAPCINGHLNP